MFKKSTEKDVVHTYEFPGDFDVTLIVENEFQCSDTFSISPGISVIDGGNVIVPNAFSPNPEGPSSTGNISEGAVNNDIFFPKVSGNLSNFQLLIFNRWGELLFESQDENIGWDGYYRGELSKQDVYVYRLEITFASGRTEVLTGDISLIR